MREIGNRALRVSSPSRRAAVHIIFEPLISGQRILPYFMGCMSIVQTTGKSPPSYVGIWNNSVETKRRIILLNPALSFSFA